MFFDQAFGGGGMGGGLGGSPSAFTSPGMNPQMLAMLMAMQNRGGAGVQPAPPPPPLPQPMSAGGGGGIPNTPPGVQPSNPMDFLKMLSSIDPNKLRQMLGMGAGIPSGAGPGFAGNTLGGGLNLGFGGGSAFG